MNNCVYYCFQSFLLDVSVREMLISELVTHILELFLGKQTEVGISHIVHAELKWTSPLGNPSVNTQGHSQNNKLTKANAHCSFGTYCICCYLLL